MRRPQKGDAVGIKLREDGPVIQEMVYAVRPDTSAGRYGLQIDVLTKRGYDRKKQYTLEFDGETTLISPFLVS